MSLARTLAVAICTLLAACTLPIEGKDAFIKQARSAAGTFPVNYQALYRCFIDREGVGSSTMFGEGPTAGIYPALGLAEYKLGKHDQWFMLVEFREEGAGTSNVRVYDTRQSMVDQLWGSVNACSKELIAQGPTPAHR